MKPWFAVILIASLAACGGDDDPGFAGDGGGRDGGRRDGGRPMEVDAGPDPCGDVICEPFELCDRGTCREYPACVSMDMCETGTVCRHRFCLPEDSDPDEDGVTAATDCDETNPAVHPGAVEVCNGIDDDCDMDADEGDPGELCAMDPSRGVCIEGRCGCPEGSFDLDRDVSNGCECTAMPARNVGIGCAAPIDLGDVMDSGQTMMVSGNVMPDDREVWYRFRGVDSADSSCDNYHVRVQLTTNPGDVFGFYVYRGACETADCAGMGPFTDYRWATDFRDGAGVGECPCAPAPGAPGANVCNDDTADFFVRIFRKPGMPVSCEAYTLEITNGVYDS